MNLAFNAGLRVVVISLFHMYTDVPDCERFF
eukprot:UN01087